jgi:Tfp pilus assembly protein PilE
MTLVELMVVVAMVGVFAALATFSVRRFLTQAKSKGDADAAMLAMVGAMRAYYDQTRGYLDCSSNFDDFYPMTPNASKHLLNYESHSDYDCWKHYNIKMGPTYMSFAVRAGTKNDSPPQPPTDHTFDWPSPTGPWFVLVGTVDLDNDKTYGRYVASSFEPGVIHRENEGE